MKHKLQSIQVKIVLWAGLCLLLTGISLVAYAVISLGNTAQAAASAEALAVAESQAGAIRADIEVALDTSRTIAQILQTAKTDPSVGLSREQVNAMLRRVLVDNPQFLGTYTLWEPNAFDGKDAEYANTEGHDETGRFIPYWIRNDQGNPAVEALLDYEVEGTGDYYLIPKKTMAEQIIDPYLYPIQGVDTLLISLVVPIVVDGQFYGIAGIDMPVGFLQAVTDEMNLYDGTADMLVVSNNGTLSGVTAQPELVGKSLDAYHSDGEDYLALVQAGQSLVQNNADHMTVFTPIHFGNTTTPWAVNLNVPTAKIFAKVNALTWQLIGVGSGLILVALLLLWFLSGKIAAPIKQMAQALETIGKYGDLTGNMSVDARKRSLGMGGEVGQMGQGFVALEAFLKEKAQVASSVAQGDLSVTVTPLSEKDEFGRTFALMIANLRQLVGQVADTAANVGSASGQLSAAAEQAGQATNQVAATIQQVAQGTAQQTEGVAKAAGMVEQVARAIDGVASGAQEQATAVNSAMGTTTQMATVIQHVASSAQAQAKGSAEAMRNTRAGVQTVEETIKGMASIKAKVDLSAQKVQEMGQRSHQIGVIVETIDDIASQTNLLALNAAIEAARAGEHGKGFAVVADEVRKLAEKSAAATKEIAGLIRGIQETVTDAVKAMADGTAEVETGVARANEARQALVNIQQTAEDSNRYGEEIAAAAQQMAASSELLVRAMETVSAVVEENTASTEEMAAGSSEVTGAIEGIASVSEENSAAVEEVNAAAEEMSAQVEEVSASAQSLSAMAQELLQLTTRFKLDNSVAGAPVSYQEPKQPAPVAAPQNGRNGHHRKEGVSLKG
jgi:methyl-accepting chemotaxis protein